MAGEVRYMEKIDDKENVLETLRRYMIKLDRKEMLNEEEARTLINLHDAAYKERGKARGEEYRRLAEIYEIADEAITKIGELAKEMGGEPKEITLEKGKLLELHSNRMIDDLKKVLEDTKPEEVENVSCVYRKEKDGRLLLLVPEVYANEAQEFDGKVFSRAGSEETSARGDEVREVQGEVTFEDWKKFLEEAKSGVYCYRRKKDKLPIVLNIFTF